MKKIITALVFFLVLFHTAGLSAQDLLKSDDLSTVRVDNLTDADLSKIRTQLQSNNMTLDQAEPLVLAKGMSASEFAKLRSRLAIPLSPKTENTTLTTDTKPRTFGREQEKIVNTKVKDSLNALVFGSELFDNPTLDFAPNLSLATPLNYILGPGDEMQISVYGVQEYNANIPVSVEGKINIQFVGEISVLGLSIEAATQKIRTAVARVYSTVQSGQSQIGVSLSRIRTIKVTIIGSQQPGNYAVSSLATVFNALHMAGGPAKNGSYRNIELVRNNTVIRNIDIYRFLVSGNQSDNVGLKENDVIRIPAYSQRVILEGEVKRPGIFEMRKGESFAELLSFASGFNEFAFTASVNIIQKTSKEFKVRDIQAAEFSTYKPQSGDVFKVSRILNRFENRIKITGAVFRPNTYSFYEGMQISDLLKQAEGLKEDAYLKRATVLRLKADLTTEAVHVNLASVLNGDVQADLALRKEDIVTVYSILDFRDDFKVTIDGEIKTPGDYDFYDKLSLNDLLVQAGGLIGSASKRVEIARMIRADDLDPTSQARAELFNITISPENNEQARNFDLQAFDVVSIRRMAVFEKPKSVTISGAVAYSGKYVLAKKTERVYDIILRAGGLTTIANLDGVKIKRPIQAKQMEDLENINLNLGKNDSIQRKLEKKIKEDRYAIIPIDWRAVVKDPSDNANISLFEGDEIEVATYDEGVKVTGSVLLTSQIPFESGKGFHHYIDAVGGVDAKGWKKKAYIIYPNGRAAVPSSFLFIRSYPKVVAGSQIVVPEKPEVKKMTTAEVISIGSVLASLSLLILTAFR